MSVDRAVITVEPLVGPGSDGERQAARRCCARAALAEKWPTGELAMVLEMLGLEG